MKPPVKKIDPDLFPIGEHLRNLRIERKLSIREMSTICGIAVNILSLIENGKSIPTINTLQNIANSLKIPITSFFDNSRKTYHVDSVKKFDRFEQSTSHGYISSLYSNENKNSFLEPYVIRVSPFSTITLLKRSPQK